MKNTFNCDEVFEGEAEALNKLYRDAGLPVEDDEECSGNKMITDAWKKECSADDQSLDKILEKDVKDISLEEILKVADYLDKQAN